MKNINLHLSKSHIRSDEILRVTKHLRFSRNNVLFVGKPLLRWGYRAITTNTNELGEGDIVKLYLYELCKVLWSR